MEGSAPPLRDAFGSIQAQFLAQGEEIRSLNEKVQALQAALRDERVENERQQQVLRQQNADLMSRNEDAARRASQLELEVARYARMENERVLAETRGSVSVHGLEKLRSTEGQAAARPALGSGQSSGPSSGSSSTVNGAGKPSLETVGSSKQGGHDTPGVSFSPSQSLARTEDEHRRAAADSLMSDEGSEQLLLELDRSIASLREHGDELLHRYAQESEVTAGGEHEEDEQVLGVAGRHPRRSSDQFGRTGGAVRADDRGSARAEGGRGQGYSRENGRRGTGTIRPASGLSAGSPTRSQTLSQVGMGSSGRAGAGSGSRGGAKGETSPGAGSQLSAFGVGASVAERGAGATSRRRLQSQGGRPERPQEKQGGGKGSEANGGVKISSERAPGRAGRATEAGHHGGRAQDMDGGDGEEGEGAGGLEDATRFFETLQKTVSAQELGRLMGVLARFNSGEVTQRDVMKEATGIIGKRRAVLDAFEDFLLGE